MTSSQKIARTHDDVLEEIAEMLDIPPSKFEEATERYESLGSWLDRPESKLSAYDPVITPQGSFLLGTVTRPLTETEEYDVDLVCLLKAAKTDFTQKSLKETVGDEVQAYARSHNMDKQPEEKRRCWTMYYADGAQFHMDVLPALPDAQKYQAVLEKLGHRKLAHDSAISGQAIAITDNTLPQYKQVTDDWPQSNPLGYAAWFRNRMTVQLLERKKAMVSRGLTMDSVEDIPDHKIKTPLQRAVQLLKRHRDCMFAKDGEHKPISIIITTLAAHAYNNEPTISGALQSILTTMDRHIDYNGNAAWIPNPVNPAENFADTWVEEPQKRKNFFLWLDRARKDFGLYIRANAFDRMPEVLKENLGPDLVNKILKVATPVTTTTPAIIKTASNSNDMRRAEAAAEDVRRMGTQSKPWAKS